MMISNMAPYSSICLKTAPNMLPEAPRTGQPVHWPHAGYKASHVPHPFNLVMILLGLASEHEHQTVETGLIAFEILPARPAVNISWVVEMAVFIPSIMLDECIGRGADALLGLRALWVPVRQGLLGRGLDRWQRLVLGLKLLLG